MQALIVAFSRSVKQLSDPALRRILWVSVVMAMVVFALLFAGVIWLLVQTALLQWGWLDSLVDILGGLAALIISWLFFPTVVGMLVALYLEDVAKTVEARHYPDLDPVKAQPLAEMIASVIQFLGLAVALNLVVLLFLIIPPLFPFVFYGINGYLLSREFFEMVALRRMDKARARRLRRANRGILMVYGVLIALLLTVPIVNLVTPIVATAAMVHLVEVWRERADSVLGAIRDVA